MENVNILENPLVQLASYHLHHKVWYVLLEQYSILIHDLVLVSLYVVLYCFCIAVLEVFLAYT